MYEEIQFPNEDAAFETAQERRWKREMEDSTDIIGCPACANVDLPKRCDVCYGAGELIIPKDEEVFGCEYCRESNDDLQEVESRDDEVGYYEVTVMCRACRRAPMEAEAAAEGGLIPDALLLLGVEESWLYEGSTAPSKPVGREVAGIKKEEGRAYGD